MAWLQNQTSDLKINMYCVGLFFNTFKTSADFLLSSSENYTVLEVFLS